MTTNIHRMFRAAALALCLAHAPAYAASESEGSKPEPVESKSADKDADRKDRVPKGASDTASCRRDAHGLSGPERARFMTSCLRERR